MQGKDKFSLKGVPFHTSPDSKEALWGSTEWEEVAWGSRVLLFCLSPSSLFSCIIAYLEMTSSSRLIAKLRFSLRRRARAGSDRAGSMPMWKDIKSEYSSNPIRRDYRDAPSTTHQTCKGFSISLILTWPIVVCEVTAKVVDEVKVAPLL